MYQKLEKYHKEIKTGHLTPLKKNSKTQRTTRKFTTSHPHINPQKNSINLPYKKNTRKTT